MAGYNLPLNLNFQVSTSDINRVRGQVGQGLRDIPISIDARNVARTNSEVRDLGNNLNRAARQAETLGEALAKQVKSAAIYTVIGGAINRVTGAISNATRESIRYQAELVKIAQVTRESSDAILSQSSALRKISVEYNVSLKKTAELTRILTQTGLSFREASKGAEILARTSLLATFDSLTSTTEGLIAVMNTFSISVDKAAGVLESINSLSKRYAVESSDLVEAISRTGGAFQAAGGQINELLALITSVRSTTRESVETIATGFRTIFGRLQRPATIQYFKDLGIALTDLEGNFVGPFKAIQEISAGLQRLGIQAGSIEFAQAVEQIGGIRQLSKVVPLLQQAARAQDALNIANNAGQESAEDIAKAQQTLAFQIGQTQKNFQAFISEVLESSSFQTFAKTLLSIANALIEIGRAVAPLIPLLTTMAAVKFGGGLLGGKGLAGATRGVIGFARGGVVPGSGNSDTVPAMLTPGEFVIRKSAVNAFGAENLAGINKYAKGGPVLGSSLGSSAIRNKVNDPNVKPEEYQAGNYINPTDKLSFRKIEIGLKGTIQDKNGKERIMSPDQFENYAAQQLGRTRITAGQDGTPNAPIDLVGGKYPIEVRNRKERTSDSVLLDKYLRYRLERNNRLVSNTSQGEEELTVPGKVGIVYNTAKLDAEQQASVSRRTPKNRRNGGLSSGTDTVPALLTPGEFVVNQKSAKSFGYGNLHKINKYAKGGAVGPQKFALGGAVGGGGALLLTGLITQFEGLNNALLPLITALTSAGLATSLAAEAGGSLRDSFNKMGRSSKKAAEADDKESLASSRNALAIAAVTGVAAGMSLAFNNAAKAAEENKKKFIANGKAQEAAKAATEQVANEQASSAVTQGAAAGAFFGSMFGPIGTVIGGLVGAILGMTGGITKFTDALASTSIGRWLGLTTSAMKQEAAARAAYVETIEKQNNDLLAATNESIEKLNQAGKGQDAASVASGALLQFTKRIDENKNKLKGSKEAQDSFNKSLRDAAKGGFDVFAGQIRNIAQANPSKTFREIIATVPGASKAIREYSAAMGTESINLLRDGIDAASAQVRLETQRRAALNQLLVQQARTQEVANQYIAQLSDSLRNMDASIAGVNQSITGRGQFVAGADLSNLSVANTATKDFDRSLAQVASLGGIYAQEANKVRKGLSQFNQTFTEGLANAASSEDISSEVLSIFRNIQTPGLSAKTREALIAQVATDLKEGVAPTEVTKKIIDQTIGPSAQLLANVQKAEEAVIQKRIEINNKILDAEQDLIKSKVDTLNAERDINQKLRGLVNLSPDQRFNIARRERIDISRRALSGTAFAGATGTNQELNAISTQIATNKILLSGLSSTDAGFRSLSNETAKLELGLQTLTDRTEEAAAMQDKLKESLEGRATLRGAGQDIAFGTPESRVQFAKTFQQALITSRFGANAVAPGDRSNVQQFLERFSKLPVFAGQTGQQILDRETQRGLAMMGFNQQQIAEIMADLTPTEEQMLEQIKEQLMLDVQRNDILKSIETAIVLTGLNNSGVNTGIPATLQATGVQGIATGGTVGTASASIFQPKGTDTVPAMLTPGEFVIRKSSVDKIGLANLERMNKTGVLYAQDGAEVPSGPSRQERFMQIMFGRQFLAHAGPARTREELLGRQAFSARLDQQQFALMQEMFGGGMDIPQFGNQSQLPIFQNPTNDPKLQELQKKLQNAKPMQRQGIYNAIRKRQFQIQSGGAARADQRKQAMAARADQRKQAMKKRESKKQTEEKNRQAAFNLVGSMIQNDIPRVVDSPSPSAMELPKLEAPVVLEGKAKKNAELFNSQIFRDTYASDPEFAIKASTGRSDLDKLSEDEFAILRDIQMQNLEVGDPRLIDYIQPGAVRTNMKWQDYIDKQQAIAQRIAQREKEAAERRAENSRMLEQGRALAIRSRTGYASGGFVDSVPAMLTPGEFVMNRSAVQGIGRGTLEAMNRGGRVRGYANGGYVGGTAYLADGGQANGGIDFSAFAKGINDFSTNVQKLIDMPKVFEISLNNMGVNVNLNGAEFLATLPDLMQATIYDQILANMNVIVQNVKANLAAGN